MELAPSKLYEGYMSDQTTERRRRTLVGRVVSDKMDKTVTVEVTRRVKHARYHKYVSRRKNFKAHDEQNDYHINDVVVIEECRPLSKLKRWVVIERRSGS
jgi:small subunit ribosomal protein S17